MKSADIEPAVLWKHFFHLCRTPHCSGNESAVRDYVLRTAALNGLAAKMDSTGNVVVVKDAVQSRRGCPIVVLQCHLDMVCEKNKDTLHDFQRDPIRWTRDENWIRAEGTTLGADNGIAVAALLALVESLDVQHGPLELLFTVDEETGLTGAFGLDPGMLQGRILINLDSEEEGTLFIGCAGGVFTDLRLALETEPVPGSCASVRIRVGGLHGGHSGLNINEGRANAIGLMVRFLQEVGDSLSPRVSHLDGGNKPNAIPRECDAEVCLPEARLPDLRKAVEAWQGIFRGDYREIEPGLEMRVDPADPPPGRVLRQADQKRLLSLLRTLPHGVLAMSATLPGAVETSTNLGILQCDKGEVFIRTKQRSSSRKALLDASETIGELGRKAGAETSRSGEYPAWTPILDSAILRHAQAVRRSLFGEEPEVKIIHAGLECGIIRDKFSGMDTISFGPTIVAAHSPGERVDIRSTQRFWEYLVAVLERLPPGDHPA